MAKATAARCDDAKRRAQFVVESNGEGDRGTYQRARRQTTFGLCAHLHVPDPGARAVRETLLGPSGPEVPGRKSFSYQIYGLLSG